MQRNKPGLADLKALRQRAESPEPAPAPARPQRAARKRAPFLPPSAAQTKPADTRVTQSDPGGARAGARHASVTSGQHEAASTTATPPPLSDADRRLFRNAVRYVEKIRDPGRVLLAPVASAPPAMLKERRMRAAGLESRPAPGRLSSTDKSADRTPARTPRLLSDAYAPAASEQDDSRYLKSGHGTDVIRDLKRGKWPISASLDLHGSTLEDARERFERFLASCLAHDMKCVRIVHGKGYGSRDGDAVLKTAVRRWLIQLADVIAYTECSEADGGSGAVQVLLK